MDQVPVSLAAARTGQTLITLFAPRLDGPHNSAFLTRASTYDHRKTTSHFDSGFLWLDSCLKFTTYGLNAKTRPLT